MLFPDKALLNQSLLRQIPERKFYIIRLKFYSVKSCHWTTTSLSHKSLPTRAPADRAAWLGPSTQHRVREHHLTGCSVEWQTCTIFMQYSKHHNFCYFFNLEQDSTVEDTASFMAHKWGTHEFLRELRMSAAGRCSLGLVSGWRCDADAVLGKWRKARLFRIYNLRVA